MKNDPFSATGLRLGTVFKLVAFTAIISLSLLVVTGLLLVNAMANQPQGLSARSLVPLAAAQTSLGASGALPSAPSTTRDGTLIPPPSPQGDLGTPLILTFLTLVLLGLSLVTWCYHQFIRPLTQGIENMLEEVSGNVRMNFSDNGSLFELRELKLLQYISECLIERNAQYENTRRVLHREIIIDPLTQLFNRKGFQILSKRIVGMLGRVRAQVSIVMIDLDHFKHVNDTHGHAVGDQVLAAVAKCMRRLNRYGDIFARYGGEEFLLLTTNCDAAGAQAHAERIRKAIADLEIRPTPSVTLRITASLGVTTFEADKTLIEDAIQHADAMLYEAKRSGRNRVCSDPFLLQRSMLIADAWDPSLPDRRAGRTAADPAAD